MRRLRQGGEERHLGPAERSAAVAGRAEGGVAGGEECGRSRLAGGLCIGRRRARSAGGRSRIVQGAAFGGRSGTVGIDLRAAVRLGDTGGATRRTAASSTNPRLAFARRPRVRRSIEQAVSRRVPTQAWRARGRNATRKRAQATAGSRDAKRPSGSTAWPERRTLWSACGKAIGR